MATHCKDYEFQRIEPHWQSFWEANETFRAVERRDKPKYYVLGMFPYPSGAGLHLGHVENYTATDIIARYRRARGHNVLHPIGWDAFGLPTEQFAIKTGMHPAETSRNNIDNYRSQFKRLGFGYNWEREVDTTDPQYFRWTQWIFLQLFRRGLAYVDEKPVWWCPELRTVLANEEVVDGRSERGNHPVERRLLRQWVLRITAYADRLLSELPELDWPESTKRMQEAWIGRSEGTEILFPLEDAALGALRVYTTRADTLFGATYLVLSPEHPLVPALTISDRQGEVDAYRRQAAAKSDLERTDLAKDKTGVFIGSFARHPLTGRPVPIWVADYVLMSYGTGAIMAVPAHDQRDFDFARKYQIPIVRVIEPAPADRNGASTDLPYLGEGRLVHSDDFTGIDSTEARRRITAALAERGRGQPSVQYKLRDWLFSRQRYWGEPFPIVWVSEEDYRRAQEGGGLGLPEQPISYTADGKTHFALPLPESALPLPLPEVSSYLPSGSGESPLANATDWLEIWHNWQTGEAVAATSPKPPGETWVRARRETNTMPQWAGSCWYHLRYLDPHNAERIVDPEREAYWGVPDLYIGGAEHAVLHLLYARFWHKFLFDEGILTHAEPYRHLFHQGIILGEDGQKMSKSIGNVVNPDAVIGDYGSDTLRLYLMFLGPLEAMKPWNPHGIEGVHRFLRKLWRELVGEDGAVHAKISREGAEAPEIEKLLHETIRKVTEDIEHFRLNTAISQMMILLNHLHKAAGFQLATAKALLRLLAPFAPHIAEELWARLGEAPSILDAPWPVHDPAKLVSQTAKVVFQVNGKFRGDALVPADATESDVVTAARAHPRVAPFLEGKQVSKIVYVPGRILNLVLTP